MRVRCLNLALSLVVVAATSAAIAQALPREVRERMLEAVVELVPFDPDTGRLASFGGSGTIISRDGFVLTNFHVIGDDVDGSYYTWHAVFVTDPRNPDLATELAYWARFIAGDARHDLAIVKIELLADESPLPPGATFSAMPVGDSNSLIPGDPITVVGYPSIGGLTVTVTTGIVSGWLGEDLESGGKQWIKTDARIAGGNSGGGAFDENGLLVAVPTARLQTNDRGFEEQNLLRPVALALPLINAHVPSVERSGGVSALAPAPDRPAPVPTPAPATVAPPAATTPAAGPVTTITLTGTLDASDEQLDSGEYVDLFEQTFAAGVPVDLWLRSEQFDVYLGVIGPDGAIVFEVDDTPGEGLNVREAFVPTQSGVYVLVVTSAFPKETGSYQLDVAVGGAGFDPFAVDPFTAPNPFATAPSGPGAAPDPFATPPSDPFAAPDPFAATPSTPSAAPDPFATPPSDPFAAPAGAAASDPFALAVVPPETIRRALDPALGTVGSLPFGARVDGRLAGIDGVSYHTYIVDVPVGTPRVSFVMQADADLDLVIKYGSDIVDWGDGGDWLQRDLDVAPFATLTVDAPAAGRWYVDILFFNGAPATAFYTFETR